MISRISAYGLVLLALIGICRLGLGGPLARHDAALARPDEKQAVVDEARLLLDASRTHLSYGVMLTVLQDSATRASKCADSGIKPFDSDLGVQAGTYRNMAVAAQQSFQVVIEKAGQWPASKLSLTLERGKKDLAKAEKLRESVAGKIASNVLGAEADGENAGEITSGMWSGFTKKEPVGNEQAK